MDVIILDTSLMCYSDFMIPRHLSKTNQILEKLGLSAIDWQL
jgi:uracil DNA glycosylase